jgi:hypothetical protein
MARQQNALVHTPEELLSGARRLMEADDPIILRAAVLEAITALEAFVHKNVFSVLRERIDPLLVKWLEDKTRMDFDSRLSVLTPIATGIEVDQQAELWTRYKRAKKLRNAVTHSGLKVTYAQASEVLQTVHDWLAYLASSAELDSALMKFKHEVEAGILSVVDEKSAAQSIADFFSKSSPAKASKEYNAGQGVRADVVLRFGERLVLVETKFFRGERAWPIIRDSVQQLEHLMVRANAERGALVIFSHEMPSLGEAHLNSLSNGKVSIVSVRLSSGDD